MNAALICLGMLFIFILPGQFSDAYPVVTLFTNKSVYFTEGGSIELICELNEDLGSLSVWFKRDRLNWIRIRNSSTCDLHKLIPSDLYTYNVTCNNSRRFVLVIDGMNASDHKTTWRCETAPYKHGPCSAPKSMCVSEGLPVFLKVPVTTVRLTDDSGQPVASPVTVANGSIKNLSCDTSPNGSRPNASFTWYKRMENHTSTLIEDQSIYSTPATQQVPGQPEMDLLISYNILSLSFEMSHQKMYIFCAARDKTNSGIYIQSQEVQINIVYPPLVSLLSKSIDFKVREGSQYFGLLCQVSDANPQQQYGFIWLFNGKVIKNETASSYVIQRVQRSDAGQYQCKVNNSYGTGTSENVMLLVQYGAKITNLSVIKNGTLNENDTATLSCFVDSNPKSDITWTKEGSAQPLKTDFTVLQSHLHFNYAQCQDASYYTCKASNGVSTHVERRIQLQVNCHPRTDIRSPQATKVYSKLRGDVDLTYTVISYPDPSFVWIFIGNGSEKRPLPNCTTQKDDGQKSTLTFTGLDVEDFGFYSVTATNPLPPSATFVFELVIADVPEIPYNVMIVDVTPKSVTVQWLAGHSGGPEQTFHILVTSSEFTRGVYAADPGYGKVGSVVIEDLTPNTKYDIYIFANNTLATSSMTEAIIVYTPSAENAAELNLLVGGVTAVVVLIVVAIAICILKREWCSHGTCRKQGQQSSQRIELSADLGRVSTNHRNEATSEHESLQADTTNENAYLEVYDVTLDDSARENISSPEGVTYEQLHMYENSQDQIYSSLTRPHKE